MTHFGACVTSVPDSGSTPFTVKPLDGSSAAFWLQENDTALIFPVGRRIKMLPVLRWYLSQVSACNCSVVSSGAREVLVHQHLCGGGSDGTWCS